MVIIWITTVLNNQRVRWLMYDVHILTNMVFHFFFISSFDAQLSQIFIESWSASGFLEKNEITNSVSFLFLHPSWWLPSLLLFHLLFRHTLSLSLRTVNYKFGSLKQIRRLDKQRNFLKLPTESKVGDDIADLDKASSSGAYGELDGGRNKHHEQIVGTYVRIVTVCCSYTAPHWIATDFLEDLEEMLLM